MNIQPAQEISDRCLELIQDSMSSLTREQDKFRRFVDQVLDRIENTQGQLLEQAASLSEQEEQLGHETQEFEQREHRTQIALEMAQSTIANLNQKLQQTEQAHAETQNEIDGLTGIVAMLEKTQEELDQSRSDHESLRNDADGHNAEIEQENQQLRNQLQDAKREIGCLTSKSNEQAKRLHDQRVEWTKELRAMRANLENRRHSIANRPATVLDDEPKTEPPESTDDERRNADTDSPLPQPQEPIPT